MDKNLLNDNLLKKAIAKACDEDYFKFMTSFKGFHIFSREFERDMNVMIKKYNNAVRKAKAKLCYLRYFLISMGIILVVIVIILGVEPLRESFLKLLKELFNTIKAYFSSL
ncbi:hypothetical protein [Asaccharospora irregularis]|uniref:Uncharacterized protein n=1 Tax=Asaccharospora irregularis DSM 2635 TaxID=1121321 RepID=A0A1M5QYM2_9FIRM|nr:hypothetical protein [Asaccharospora irregularis]SHH19287.1 hypothetical protein SAMN04488530_12527 [Asaccharospora irregularis DSM 2635]